MPKEENSNNGDSTQVTEKIEEIKNVSNELGQLFGDEIVPSTLVCEVIELENYNEIFPTYEKYYLDKKSIDNINLESLYVTYKQVFAQNLVEFPEIMNQVTINRFTQLQLRYMRDLLL